jgi:predicted GNAT superfamily acetyltransferase
MISYRVLTSLAEMQAVEELQRQVWPASELIIVPTHVLLTVVQNGGVLIGAWDEEKLIGFVFGFLGTDEGEVDRPAMTRLKHCSHMLAVLPEYRDQRIGYQLKLAQRTAVDQQAVRLITWTYDPIESRNAHLNIARLGGIVRTYKPNHYGEMSDGLNAGLPSDRLLVEWWITSHRVKQRLGGERKALELELYMAANTIILNPSRVNEAALPVLTTPFEPTDALCLVEIPANFQHLKTNDHALALEWKLQIREVLTEAFAKGYLITDYIYETIADRPRAFYVLAQGEATFGAELR